jgi:hypothetical protein
VGLVYWPAVAIQQVVGIRFRELTVHQAVARGILELRPCFGGSAISVSIDRGFSIFIPKTKKPNIENFPVTVFACQDKEAKHANFQETDFSFLKQRCQTREKNSSDSLQLPKTKKPNKEKNQVAVLSFSRQRSQIRKG